MTETSVSQSVLENPTRLKLGDSVSCSLTEAWDGLSSWSDPFRISNKLAGALACLLDRPLRTLEFTGPGLVWKCMSVIPVLGKWRQEDKSEANLCYVGGFALKHNQKFANLSRGTASLFLLGPEPKVFDWQLAM